MHAVAVVAAAHVQFRRRPRCSRKRASPLFVSGSHLTGGLSVASRSSTQPVKFVSLFLSIALDVLLSKSLLCTAEKSSHGSRIQFERGCHLLITEVVAAKKQQLGLALLHDCQDQTDSLLLFAGGVNFL